jgi:hypothetical protein
MAWASSSGALALGMPPTVVVKPGEGPPGDESVREAPSQLGDDNAFVKRVAVGFSAPGGGVIGQGFHRGKWVIRWDPATDFTKKSVLPLMDFLWILERRDES